MGRQHAKKKKASQKKKKQKSMSSKEVEQNPVSDDVERLSTMDVDDDDEEEDALVKVQEDTKADTSEMDGVDDARGGNQDGDEAGKTDENEKMEDDDKKEVNDDVMKDDDIDDQDQAMEDAEDGNNKGADIDEEIDEEDDENDEDFARGDDDDEEELQPRAMVPKPSERSAFLEAFYGLASSDPRERSISGHAVLYHSLIGPDANTEDAAYAFKRLLNGICSGRAAARQGNASALTSFLKVAQKKGTLGLIQSATDNTSTLTDVAYVRKRLIESSTTDETRTGRRRAAEEKDNHFGRLFGILSIVRSGLLSPTTSSNDGTLVESISALVGDMRELYTFKPYMREPTAHALCTLIQVLSEEDTKEAKKLFTKIVSKYIVPVFLQKGDLPGTEKQRNPFANFSAEQLAIAMLLHANSKRLNDSAFKSTQILEQPILSKDSIKRIAELLCSTYAAQPQARLHLAWDVLWVYLTEVEDGVDAHNQGRKLRALVPVSEDEQTIDMVLALMNEILEKSPVEDQEVAQEDHNILALHLLRVLMGVSFNSCLTGRTTILLEQDVLESPSVETALRVLLLNPITALGSKKRSRSNAVALSELAHDTFQNLQDTVDDMSSANRLAILKSLFRSGNIFDSRIKSSTIQRLVGVGQFENEPNLHTMKFWGGCVDYLQDRFVDSILTKSKTISTKEPGGLLDVMFAIGKLVSRVQNENDVVDDLRKSLLNQIYCFLLTLAFFDLSFARKVNEPCKRSSAAFILNQVALKRYPNCVPYNLRVILSARFFSLFTEEATVLLHCKTKRKGMMMLERINFIFTQLEELEGHGLRLLATKTEGDNSEEKPSKDAVQTIATLVAQQSNAVSADEKENLQGRATASLALQSGVLSLMVLNCGLPESGEEEIPTDEDFNDEDEIMDLIQETNECIESIAQKDTSDSNPALDLVSLSTTVLSAPLAEGNLARGATVKLLREIVRNSLSSGLLFLVSKDDDAVVDKKVAKILVASVGTTWNPSPEADAEDDSESDSESASEAGIFKAAADMRKEGNDNEESDQESRMSGESDEEEIRIDDDRLNAMLEEDSDASVDEGALEHHEGADAALARLIKMKQEARKAGQSARERIELAKQLRCASVLELVSQGKPDGWGKLLRADVVLSMITCLLRYCIRLEKRIFNSVAKSGVAGANIGERKDLLHRMTSILKTRLLKMKLSVMDWTINVDPDSHATSVVRDIVGLIRPGVSEDLQQSCCTAVSFALRQAGRDSQALTQFLEEIVIEWSTKRSTKYSSQVFDELIHHNVALAQRRLLRPLVSAAKTARTPYLKLEAFRMIAALYNTKSLNDTKVDECQNLLLCLPTAINAGVLALQDKEMMIAKRLRDILKFLGKFALFERATQKDNHYRGAYLTALKELQAAVKDAAQQTASEPAKKSGEKLVEQVDVILSAMSADQKREGDGETVVDRKKKKKRK